MNCSTPLSRRSAASHNRRRRTQGAVAIAVALLLTVLLGAGALVMDIGNIYRVRAELQNASDSAAMAAAGRLDGTNNGFDPARARAKEYAEQHYAYDGDVVFNNPEEYVEFGCWDSVLAATDPAEREPEGADPFTPYEASAACDEPDEANAAKITTHRTEEVNGPVQHFLAQFLGPRQTDVEKPAIAVGGGPIDGCGFPLVVGECSLGHPDEEGFCEQCLVFKDDNDDNAGWTSFASEGGVGQGDLEAAIGDACFEGGEDGVPNVDDDGWCVNDCSTTMAGSEIQVQNGNQLTTADPGGGGPDQGDRTVCQLIQMILNRDGVNNPQSFKVEAPVIHTDQVGGEECNDKFAGKQTVSGYAVLEIFGIKCGQDQAPVQAPGAADCGDITGEKKFVIAKLHCDAEPRGHGGGGFHGTRGRPRLVR